MGSQLDFFAALEDTNLLKTSIMSKFRIVLIRSDLWRELLKGEHSPDSVSLPLPARGHHDHFCFHLSPHDSCSCYQGKGKRGLWKRRRANLWSSTASDPQSVFCLVFDTLNFAFPDPFHSLQLAPVLPILCSSHGTGALEGQGHLQEELATRRVYNTGKLSQITWLVASWEAGKETSGVKKRKKKVVLQICAHFLQLWFVFSLGFIRPTVKWILQPLWTSRTSLQWLLSELLIINNSQTNSSIFRSSFASFWLDFLVCLIFFKVRYILSSGIYSLSL